MKRVFLILFAMIFFSVTVYATNVTVVMPTVNDAPTQAELTSIADTVSAELVVDHFGKMDDMVNMPRGFANANASATNVSSNQSFQNYEIFSVMIGSINGVILSSEPVNGMLTNQDPYFGDSIAAAINVGVNLSFIQENLYGSVKFGSLKMKYDDDSYKNTQIGIGLDYAIVPEWSYLYGLARWRGISIGSGLIYNQTEVSVKDENLGDEYKYSQGLPTSGMVTTKPLVDYTMKMQTLTIPVHVVSSVQFLWLFNIGGGFGADINVTTAKMDMVAHGIINAEVSGVVQESPGYFYSHASATSKMEPKDIVSPKVLLSLGANISALKLDIPVSYYPVTKALSFGFNIGAAW